MQSWEYVALCLIVPVVWGVVSARLFDWLQSQRTPSEGASSGNSSDEEMYYI